MEIKKASTQEDFIMCFNVIHELRPHLTLETFLSSLEEMKNEKYSLIYIEDNDKAVSALGYRYVTTLYNGHIIYIDDLVTRPETRGKGYAGKLFDYVVDLAKKQSIETIHLDSNHARYDAHRLYLNKKMKILAHHFRLEV